MDFLNCVVYLLIISVSVYFFGRIFPRKWINEEAFPFCEFAFEKGGKIYNKIHIKEWKTKLPDASLIMGKIFPKFVPTKRMDGNSKNKIPVLIKETCVAEGTHFLVALFGFYCHKIWRGGGGLIVGILFFILNLPFILIQRYNRPRLKRALFLV